MTFDEACKSTVACCPDGFAKAYANAGIGMTDREEIQTQCLYILNNMANWRGPVARACRETFKELAKPSKRRKS